VKCKCNSQDNLEVGKRMLERIKESTSKVLIVSDCQCGCPKDCGCRSQMLKVESLLNPCHCNDGISSCLCCDSSRMSEVKTVTAELEITRAACGCCGPKITEPTKPIFPQMVEPICIKKMNHESEPQCCDAQREKEILKSACCSSRLWSDMENDIFPQDEQTQFITSNDHIQPSPTSSSHYTTHIKSSIPTPGTTTTLPPKLPSPPFSNNDPAICCTSGCSCNAWSSIGFGSSCEKGIMCTCSHGKNDSACCTMQDMELLE